MSELKEVANKLGKLSKNQLDYIDAALTGLLSKVESTAREGSDIATPLFVELFGDRLKAHHGVSKRNMTKEHFERAFEAVLLLCGVEDAALTPKGLPGADIIALGSRISLKSQADEGIKENEIHISKYMELGKGLWVDKPEHLVALRARFLKHMEGYDRIFTLRALPVTSGGGRSRQITHWKYELVEIPKDLLARSADSECTIRVDSTQNPKPGLCVVKINGEEAFQLYFDGGTERKLQIRHLNKKFCTVHATWKFDAPGLKPQAPTGDLGVLRLEFNADEPPIKA